MAFSRYIEYNILLFRTVLAHSRIALTLDG
jgi:hypothetical protein